MIVTVKNKKQVSEFFKQSDSRFNSPRFKGGKDTLTAWINRHRQLVTGLTPEDEERLGKQLNADLSKNSEFWHSFQITITGEELTLYLDNPEDELKYLVLKSHFRVQSDPMKNNPLADYVLYNTVDEAKRTVSKANLKVEAFALYNKLTMADKRGLLKLYPGYARTDNVVDEIIEANLLKELEKDYAKFISRVKDKNRNSKVFIEELVSANILTKNKNMYKYGDDVLGHNLESTIAHLEDPMNQGLKIALMKELKELKEVK